MVTGRRAFAADSEVALIAAILEYKPPPLTTQQPLAPAALDGLVSACLAKDPRDRWQHARDVALALDASPEDRGRSNRPPLRTRVRWQRGCLPPTVAVVVCT